VLDLDHFQCESGVFDYGRHGGFNPTNPPKATQVTNDLFARADQFNLCVLCGMLGSNGSQRTRAAPDCAQVW
jgi:hypothetical protein